jgi:hypothetical protein
MPSQLGITQLRGQVAKSDLRRTRMAQLKPTVLRTTNNYGRFAEVMKHPASAGWLTGHSAQPGRTLANPTGELGQEVLQIEGSRRS